MRYLLVICLLLASACGSGQKSQSKTDTAAANKKTTGTQYTCTMHPDVVETKPGTCPKCGMELVEKESSK